MSEAPLIDIHDLSIGFTARDGRLLPVLRNIDLRVGRGESVGIVGESGSGKSTLALAAMGYLKRGLQVIGGSASFAGHDLLTLPTKDLEAIRGGKLALIPQNAGQSLTPSLRIGAQIDEALRLHSSCATAERPARAIDLLRRVRLPDPAAILRRYPHELSGGQQQRVAIAMALAGEPEALLLDEPTTGLDVTTQAHILELLHDLARSTGTAMLYVSHDLGAIARVCERVVVMYAGEIALEGDATIVLTAPAHPYARGLLAAIPRLDEARLPAGLDGSPPVPGQAGSACAFADRCALAEAACRAERPLLVSIDERTRARCHFHQRAMALRLKPEANETPPLQRQSGSSALALTDVSISYAKPIGSSN
jgi:peptide/nickel transport system ATP-binding protein